MKKYLFLLILFIPVSASAQANVFKETLTRSQVGEKLIKKTKDLQFEQIYLGSINDNNGLTIYHVISEFYTVQAAIQKHGHSRILFFDNQKKLVEVYRVGLPEDLPVKLINNTLYFSFKNESYKEIDHKVILGAILPEAICVIPNDCYSKQ